MKLKYILAIFCFIFCINICTTKHAAQRLEGIQNFPDSYKPYLEELQKKHPNWKFVALYTGLDWNYVIRNENIFGTSLVPKSYSDRWKNTKTGEYNVEVDAGWVDASRRAVEYTMDPRNFLNEVRIFQFESLSYDQSTNNIQGIEKILYGTEFYNRTVEYVTSSGNKVTMNAKYSDLILSAARTSQVSGFHLASRIKQEVGPFLSHSSISGTVSGYRGLYNFYNIGATSSSEPMGAIINGLKYARDGHGASQYTRDRYLIPWNNKERAITGGGIFIGSSYISRMQDNIYLQKFHVSDNIGGQLFWHQYMTNILAPYSESKSIYTAYSNNGMLSNSISFIIPVYENMNSTPVENPNILESDYVADNTRVYADVTTTLNIRSGPSTSYEVITSVDRNVKMTRIARGKQAGELWDKVMLPNGIVGYVFSNYLEKLPDEPEIPENPGTPETPNVPETPGTPNLPNVPETPVEPDLPEDFNGFDESRVQFDSTLKVEGNEITGIDTNNTTVGNLKQKISTTYTLRIYDYTGKELVDTQSIGTGSTIKLVDENGIVKMKYYIIIYGDVSGDGKINSTDLLVLQRHILEIQMLESLSKKAGNISKNGKNPSSVDSLLIQRHILEFQFIEQ